MSLNVLIISLKFINVMHCEIVFPNSDYSKDRKKIEKAPSNLLGAFVFAFDQTLIGFGFRGRVDMYAAVCRDQANWRAAAI